MSGSLLLIDLAGYVALLLWGARMVQSGVVRTYGSSLRGFLGICLGHRLDALLSGIGITTVLQSSTATGLMVTSFAAGAWLTWSRRSPSCWAPISGPR